MFKVAFDITTPALPSGEAIIGDGVTAMAEPHRAIQ